MRISDWSSDVCSSDLGTRLGPPTGRSGGTVLQAAALVGGAGAERRATEDDVRMTEFSAWIGRSEERRDRLDASRSAVLLAALGPPEAPGGGDPLPPLHRWLHFWDAKTPDQTGGHGQHTGRGRLPRVPPPRRTG